MRSRENILERLEKPENTLLRNWLRARSLEKSLPAFNDQVFDKDTTQNAEVQNKLQNKEGGRSGGHVQRAYNMINSMVTRWHENKKRAFACKSFLVPKMEIEKKKLTNKINKYYSFQTSCPQKLSGVVDVLTTVKDAQMSQKRYDVELFRVRHKGTSMHGHCSCLRPQIKRLPCVHIVFYAKSVGFPVNDLFRYEHRAKFWRWQYKGCGELKRLPVLADLEKSTKIKSPVIGAPLRGRPKKGKRFRSVLEKPNKRKKKRN